jgi:septal ring factor EnvC (AmiA/AmiB activator)
MAFENFPQADQPTQGTTAAPKNNMRTLLTAGLVVALLGTWAYIIYDKNQIKEKDDQQETMIASTSTQRDELQKELEDAAMRYDMLKSNNSKLDSTITAKDRDIE